MGEGMNGNEAAWRLPEDMGAAELLRKLAGDLLLGDAALYDCLGYGHEGFWGAEKGGVSICRALESLADMVERELLLVELCGLLGIAPMGLTDVSRQELAREFGKRVMPEGMEWPRFEGGEPVRPGSEFGYGTRLDALEVTSILFTSEGCFIEPDYSWECDDYALMVKQGQRVKRPAPKVFDADGVEIHVGDTVCGTRDMEPMRVVDTDSRECGFKRIKCEKEGDGFFFYCADELTHKLPVLAADGRPLREGDTVYLLPGEWCDKSPLYRCHGWDEMEVINIAPVHNSDRIECKTLAKAIVCYPQPSQLTHRAPVLASDGKPLREGDVLYSIKTGDSVIVESVEPDNPWFAATSGMLHHCGGFTHRAPVLAADGKPLREGEHVYHVETGAELVVKELPKPGEYQAVVVFVPPASHLTSFDPDQLTHERPDSWERLEADAKAWVNPTMEERADLVRRAKKLAGVS